MKTKPYSQHEEKPIVVNEPAVVYGSTAMPCMGMYQEADTESEIDRMAEEWLQPLTMEQVNRWNEEAEEADEMDDMDALIPHEVVVARMKQFLNSL